MRICIIGNSLTSLTLAKALVNKEIFVDIFYKNKNIPADNIRKPNISVNLLAIKRRVILTIFFMFILSESNLSLCII